MPSEEHLSPQAREYLNLRQEEEMTKLRKLIALEKEEEERRLALRASQLQQRTASGPQQPLTRYISSPSMLRPPSPLPMATPSPGMCSTLPSPQLESKSKIRVSYHNLPHSEFYCRPCTIPQPRRLFSSSHAHISFLLSLPTIFHFSHPNFLFFSLSVSYFVLPSSGFFLFISFDHVIPVTHVLFVFSSYFPFRFLIRLSRQFLFSSIYSLILH